VALSDAKERDPRSKSIGDRLEIVLVGSEDPEPTPMSDRDDMDVDYVGRSRSTGERTNVVCFVVCEWRDIAAPQETP
jgi:hypothetical protein